MAQDFEDSDVPEDAQTPKARWEIEFTADAKRAETFLKSKDCPKIRPETMFDVLKQLTTKFYKQGVFEKTIVRLLRRRYPEVTGDDIIGVVDPLYQRLLSIYPANFGKESLLDEEDRQAVLQEEPSDFPASHLKDTPDDPQGWIVPELIPDDDAILNQGDGGAGKTTTMLQLAVAVATGREWLGLPTVDEPAVVVYFSCEERTKKIKHRIRPLIEGPSSPYNGEVEWSDLNNLRIVGLADRDALVAIKDNTGRIVATEMFEFFKRKIEQHGPKLVIIDSLYDVYGGDENTRAQVKQFVSMLRRFTSRFECGLIVLGHPSLYGMATGTGTSGSTAWRNAFRGMLYTTIDKPASKGGVQVHKIAIKKGNYGPPDREIQIIWENGIFVPLSEEDAAATKATTQEGAKSVFLELLARYNDQGTAVTTALRGSYAPREFAKHPVSGDYTKADFETAMHLLLGERVIGMRDYTTPQRKRSERLEALHDAAEADDGSELDFG